jgi:hypothetical protein
MRIIHPLERFFDVIPAPVGPNDVLIAPEGLVGKENPFE